MTILTEILGLAAQADAALPLPPVASALITDPHPASDKDAEFGLLALADGCAGLYYAWLGDSQADMPARFLVEHLRDLGIERSGHRDGVAVAQNVDGRREGFQEAALKALGHALHI